MLPSLIITWLLVSVQRFSAITSTVAIQVIRKPCNVFTAEVMLQNGFYFYHVKSSAVFVAPGSPFSLPLLKPVCGMCKVPHCRASQTVSLQTAQSVILNPFMLFLSNSLCTCKDTPPPTCACSEAAVFYRILLLWLTRLIPTPPASQSLCSGIQSKLRPQPGGDNASSLLVRWAAQ